MAEATLAPPDTRRELLLSLADDELVLGHRHSEWTGWAPFIEEDLAFSSIAQDEIAHARLLYELASDDPDTLALGRQPDGYRNAVLCERPNGGWAFTLARHFVYDTADDVRLASLEGSSWDDLAEAARIMRMEEHYHLEHAQVWMRRLTDGSEEAREELRGGLTEVLKWSGDLFCVLPGELTDDGTLPDPTRFLAAQWIGVVGPTFEALGVQPPEPEAVCGARGTHTPPFSDLYAEMTALHRSAPGASW